MVKTINKGTMVPSALGGVMINLSSLRDYGVTWETGAMLWEIVLIMFTVVTRPILSVGGTVRWAAVLDN